MGRQVQTTSPWWNRCLRSPLSPTPVYKMTLAYRLNCTLRCRPTHLISVSHGGATWFAKEYVAYGDYEPKQYGKGNHRAQRPKRNTQSDLPSRQRPQ